MTYIVSGTWIPFTIGAFIRLREKQTLARAVGLALILFLFISGGYPSFMFVLLYLLIAIFLFYAIGYIRQKDFRSLLRYSGFLALAGVIMVLMSSVVLVSVYHLKDAMTRGVGVTLEEALFGAFTPQCMISFILPFAVIRNMEFFNTDLSMSNGYFGVIPLVFFFLALMLRRPKIINVFLAWGTFTLLAALGESLPVREFLYRYIPFMDQFRFPAAFRVYVILSFLVVAGFGFDNWLKGDYSLSKKLRWIVIGMAIIILGFAIAQIFRRQLDLLTFIRHEAFIFSNKSTVAQHIFFQSVIQLILLSSLYFILTEKSVIKNLPLIVIILVSADMAIATRLNGPYSIYSHIYKSKDIYRHSREHFRDGFPVPGNGLIIENRDSKLGYQTFWRNLNIFHKKVSHQGYNPMQLKGYVELADNHPRLFEAILQNRLFYQTATISSLDSLPVHEAAGIYDPTRVYFNDEDYQELKDYVSSTSPGDTVFLTGFSPLEMTIRSKSEGPVLVNLLQSYYHGWRAKVDEEPVKIYMANFGLMSVVVPAGEHEVIFGYRPVDVRIAFYVSLVVFLMGLMLLRGTL
jgi:hypothetical protein